LRQENVEFPILDVRDLDRCENLKDKFEFVLCFENIEHILDDIKLMRDMALCLKPGGRLLLTTPNYYFRAITAGGENGPYLSEVEGDCTVASDRQVICRGPICIDVTASRAAPGS
jgi:2-polyprenyl-3-methyl-5-hydroxy-6-metoxy-1,4-benzoquinol methylase